MYIKVLRKLQVLHKRKVVLFKIMMYAWRTEWCFLLNNDVYFFSIAWRISWNGSLIGKLIPQSSFCIGFWNDHYSCLEDFMWYRKDRHMLFNISWHCSARWKGAAFRRASVPLEYCSFNPFDTDGHWNALHIPVTEGNILRSPDPWDYLAVLFLSFLKLELILVRKVNSLLDLIFFRALNCPSLCGPEIL